jgi:hypothetical protein
MLAGMVLFMPFLMGPLAAYDDSGGCQMLVSAFLGLVLYHFLA